MKTLLSQVTIADSNSPHNYSIKNILIEDGFIKKINDDLFDADEVIEANNNTVSPGWVDVFSDFCDPGFEYKETLQTGAKAAAVGGFTQVFTLPNTNPVIQNKAQVEYIIQTSKSLEVHIHPIGTITKLCDGKELAEMYDMQSSGAIAFSDGLNAVQSSGLFLKALQYVKAFNGVLIQMPLDKSIGKYGLMNEGIISTKLGLPGIPAIAEEIIIKRDIELLKYTQSKLHITGISTQKSLQLISEAKNEGLNITCSVTPYHLFFCDEDLQTYDTNLKLNPPLRSKKDMLALREGLQNNLIDCIASHHIPQDWDSKTCEFEYAKYGMIGLQTSYPAIQTILPNLKPQQVTALFSINARKIFNLPNAIIKEGEIAELTIFNQYQNTIFTKENNESKSSNSPFFDKTLNGKIIGIYCKGKLILNK
ncbi:MAG: dihydroorotase [Chitinophagaceae bacterium]